MVLYEGFYNTKIELYILARKGMKKVIDGYASLQRTKRYVERFHIPQRQTPYFIASPIAIGTHLGDMTIDDSLLYRESIAFALQNGTNFIDTALNYRGMRSERDIGHVITQCVKEKVVQREEFIISTKAGIIPGDIEANLVPNEYLKQILYQNGIIQESDLHTIGHICHVLKPSYYKFAIEQSKKHLNLRTIDIHYIHNPELSMKYLGPDLFYKELQTLFTFYEGQVNEGNIRFYGMATWDAFLYDQGEDGYISLEKVIDIAKSVAGNNHHFKFIQLPYNKNRQDAVNKKNQSVNGKTYNILDAAEQLQVQVTTSAPFNGGKAISNDALHHIVKTKGILSAMVGMKHVKHVKKNLETVKATIFSF